MMMMITLTSGQRILTRSHRRGEADFSWGEVNVGCSSGADAVVDFVAVCSTAVTMLFSGPDNPTPKLPLRGELDPM